MILPLSRRCAAQLRSCAIMVRQLILRLPHIADLDTFQECITDCIIALVFKHLKPLLVACSSSCASCFILNPVQQLSSGRHRGSTLGRLLQPSISLALTHKPSAQLMSTLAPYQQLETSERCVRLQSAHYRLDLLMSQLRRLRNCIAICRAGIRHGLRFASSDWSRLHTRRDRVRFTSFFGKFSSKC